MCYNNFLKKKLISFYKYYNTYQKKSRELNKNETICVLKKFIPVLLL